MKDGKIGPKGMLLGFGSMLLTLVVLATVCGPIMGMLGFRYDSLGSFCLFFVLASVASGPLGMGGAALLDRLNLKGWDKVLIYLPLDTLASVLGFIVADQLMDTVTGSALSLGVASLIFALPGIPELKRVSEEE